MYLWIEATLNNNIFSSVALTKLRATTNNTGINHTWDTKMSSVSTMRCGSDSLALSGFLVRVCEGFWNDHGELQNRGERRPATLVLDA